MFPPGFVRCGPMCRQPKPNILYMHGYSIVILSRSALSVHIWWGPFNFSPNNTICPVDNRWNCPNYLWPRPRPRPGAQLQCKHNHYISPRKIVKKARGGKANDHFRLVFFWLAWRLFDDPNRNHSPTLHVHKRKSILSNAFLIDFCLV